MAAKKESEEKRKVSGRRGKDRRDAQQRLDERRKGGYGEIIPDRRLAARRAKAARRAAARRKGARRK